MVPLLMLGTLAAVLRLLATRGVGPGVTWRHAVLYAMSVTSVVTGLAVFTPAREDMARMVPDGIPRPRIWVVAAGTGQIVAGALLSVPAIRPAAAGALAGITILKFPANWKATRERLAIRGPWPTPPWMRIPDSILWIGLILWVGGTRARRQGDGEGRA